MLYAAASSYLKAGDSYSYNYCIYSGPLVKTNSLNYYREHWVCGLCYGL